MMERRDSARVEATSAEAADWFVRLKAGEMGYAEQRRYLRWLKASPSHIAEMLRVSKLHGRLHHAKVKLPMPPPAAEDNVIEWTPREESPPPASVSASYIWPRWKIAAAFSMVTLAALLAMVVKIAWFDNMIETQASEWRHFTLTDGSIVRVGPRSRLRLAFGDAERSIYLSHGEVMFQVAKDPARPFLVHAELAVVRAVGTEFGVSRHDGKVVVTVAEGAVAVTRSDPPVEKSPRQAAPESTPAPVVDASVEVSAGEQVAVSRSGPGAVQRVDTARELAWAHGRLIFDPDTTLIEAVAEFNRRNRVQIAIDDPALGVRRVCCVFNADDPESFAESVATKPDIGLVRESSGVLRLVYEAGMPAGYQGASPPGAI